MKINVCIEANTIEEYMEAVKALAAGYQVKPVINVTASAKAVVNDEVKVVAEDKPKRTRKQAATDKLVKEVSKLAEAPKEEKDTTTFETEEKAQEEAPTTSEQSEPKVSFVDVKLRAKQIANLPDGKSDIKFILDKLNASKLSDLTEDQYATFMVMCDQAEVQDDLKNVTEGEDKSEGSGEKEVTIEMIRGKAKQLAVAGYKEEIKDTLKAFGAPSLTKIKKEEYTAFYNALGEING